jgi:plastocyanin
MRRTLLSLTGAAALALTLSACGDSGSDDAASDGCTPVDGTFTVHAKDALKFDAEEYTADAGCIEVTYTNDGSLAHTLLIKDQPDFKKLSIGDTDKGTVTLEPGTYTIYCDIAGHESAGMEAELTVS